MKVERVIVTKAKPEKVIPAVAERIIPAQPEHRRIVTETICDVCGKKEARHTCYVCGRDICGKCRHYLDVTRCGGDYSDDHVCKPCLSLRAKYHAKEDELEEEHDKQDEALREEWKAESLASKGPAK